MNNASELIEAYKYYPPLQAFSGPSQNKPWEKLSTL
jgi:hypothetical protein